MSTVILTAENIKVEKRTIGSYVDSINKLETERAALERELTDIKQTTSCYPMIISLTLKRIEQLNQEIKSLKEIEVK